MGETISNFRIPKKPLAFTAMAEAEALVGLAGTHSGTLTYGTHRSWFRFFLTLRVGDSREWDLGRWDTLGEHSVF